MAKGVTSDDPDTETPPLTSLDDLQKRKEEKNSRDTDCDMKRRKRTNVFNSSGGTINSRDMASETHSVNN